MARVQKWRGAVIEWAKASAPGRRVAPSWRARRMWLLWVSWLGWAVCARQQPAGS